MTEEQFSMAVQDLLARPVDGLSAEERAAVVQQCIGKSSAASSWWSQSLAQVWVVGLPVLAVLTRPDWGLLSIIWILAVCALLLLMLLPAVDRQEGDASGRITKDELRGAVHHLLAQPVDELSVEDKAEAIQACLADMRRKESRPWWFRTVNLLAGCLVLFAGAATVAVLFPGIAWFWCLGLGLILGSLVALLLLLIVRGVMWVLAPAVWPSNTEDAGASAATGRPRDTG